MRLQDKVIIVTGSTTGIGRAIAIRCVEEGAKLVIHGLEEGGVLVYAKRLRHGEIGKGLNDFDSIFKELTLVHFDGWISIEDGVEGMDQLERSVTF